MRSKKKIYDVINSPTTAAPMVMEIGSMLITTLIKNILNTNKCTTKLKCIIFLWIFKHLLLTACEIKIVFKTKKKFDSGIQ